jgi:hypothetical protein
MHIFSRGIFLVVAKLALFGQTLSPNVCAVQKEYARSDDAGKTQRNMQITVVRGRAVFSPRGFWVLTESGCAGIPVAEVLEGVKPKASFQLVKDEKYQELQNARDQSRNRQVVVELEGRLDRISKKTRNVEKEGSAAIHISKYEYMLVLRRVRAIQLE